MQIDANAVIDKLSSKIAEISKELAIAQVLVDMYEKKEQEAKTEEG